MHEWQRKMSGRTPKAGRTILEAAGKAHTWRRTCWTLRPFRAAMRSCKPVRSMTTSCTANTFFSTGWMQWTGKDPTKDSMPSRQQRGTVGDACSLQLIALCS